MSFWVSDFPTWLQGVGTVGAFGTGGWLLKKEIDRDRDRDQERADERTARKRAQAERVTIWTDDEPDKEVFPVNDPHNKIVRARNGSDLAIFDLTFVFYLGPPLRPEGYRPYSHASISARVLPPGEEANVPFPNTGVMYGDELVDETFIVDVDTVTLTFRDANGVMWARTSFTLDQTENPFAKARRPRI